MAKLFTYAETAPLTPTTGAGWIQPSTGQVYLYLNAGWQPFISGVSGAYKYPLSVFISGIDQSENIDCNSFRKSDVLTTGVDTCSFTLFDYYNNISPEEGEEIIVYYKLTIATEAEKIFAGRISGVKQAATAPGQLSFEYTVNCVDYSNELKKMLVIEVYQNTLAGDIIKDIITNYTSGFTVNNIQDSKLVAYISFNYKSVDVCIKELADLTGYDWYVDYDKDIHFFSKQTNTAPYTITENVTTTGHYKNLDIKVDKSQLRNKVYVRGGVYLSNLFTQERVADGIQLSFNLDYKPCAPVSVYIDVGAGYVLHSLGIDNIDTAGKDFVVNYNEKLIKNLDHYVLAAGNKIKITYTYEVQVLTEDTDDASILAMQAIEGGTGIYEYIIIDTTIQTLNSAHDRAGAELEKYANPSIDGSYKTDQHGYRSGQILTLQLPNWGYNGTQFLIEKVTSSLQSDNKFEYDISFSSPLTKSLERFLIELLDSGKQIIVRENETLHELFKTTTQIITMTDITPTVANEVILPFIWDDAVSIWDEAEWT